MKRVIRASDEAKAAKYQVDTHNIIQFDFYAFPVSVNGVVIMCDEVLGRDTFDNFVDPIRKALRQADRAGLIDTHKAEESGQRDYTEYLYIFTVVEDDGHQADTVGCMIRIALHEWGEPGRMLPDAEKEATRRAQIQKYAPKFIAGSECIIVDSGFVSDAETGELGDYYEEAMIEIISDPNVKVLTVEEARQLLQNELRNKWHLDLPIEW